MSQHPKIEQFGEAAILISWESKTINIDINNTVVIWSKWLYGKYFGELIEIVPTYHSLAVYFKKKVAVADFLERLKSDSFPNASFPQASYLYKIPVCYDLCFGLDLSKLSKSKNRPISEIIKKHTKAVYTVCFLGFLPGFPYLSGLSEELSAPRKMMPRERIDAGAVAIGGAQTGIYPIDSPGGWNIIGKTPINIFDVSLAKPSLFKAGDMIQFYEITKTEFDAITEKIKTGNYKLGKTLSDD